jgi:hypothetical protein
MALLQLKLNGQTALQRPKDVEQRHAFVHVTVLQVVKARRGGRFSTSFIAIA